ncbi:MAG: hypothetical protein U5R06_18730 [candidate division KSB1 bacterium]|nr:hypothetical protein [candidate division KSB1 bacterium]
MGLIYLVIVIVTSSSLVGEFLFLGPLQVGIFLACFKKMRGETVRIGDIGQGFTFFVAAVLSSILITVFSFIGFLLCIIPGFIIIALYMLTPAFIAEKNLDFWSAMEASRKTVSQYLLEFVLLTLVLLGINLLGALALGVGLVFSIPLSFAIIAAAYDELVGLEPQS